LRATAVGGLSDHIFSSRSRSSPSCSQLSIQDCFDRYRPDFGSVSWPAGQHNQTKLLQLIGERKLASAEPSSSSSSSRRAQHGIAHTAAATKPAAVRATRTVQLAVSFAFFLAGEQRKRRAGFWSLGFAASARSWGNKSARAQSQLQHSNLIHLV
jgi:hypothetical protein